MLKYIKEKHRLKMRMLFITVTHVRMMFCNTGIICHSTTINITIRYFILTLDRQIDGWMDGWMDGRTDGRMDGWMNRWIDGWMDGFGNKIHEN